MGIRSKLLSTSLILSLLPFLLVGGFILYQSREAIIDQAFRQLVSIREIRKTHLENYFVDHSEHMDVLLAAVANFRQAAEEMLLSVRDQRVAALVSFFDHRLEQHSLIAVDPDVEGALSQFGDITADDLRADLNWTTLAGYYDSLFKKFIQVEDYDDLLLLNRQGRVIYSVARRQELGTSVLEGALQQSPLAAGFRRAMGGDGVVVDFQPYGPTGGDYRAVLATPIRIDGEVAGVVATLLVPEVLDTIVTGLSPIAETGQVYLVGRDDEQVVYRNNRGIQAAIGTPLDADLAASTPVLQGLAGEAGITTRMGDSYHLVLSAYAPVPVPGVEWAINVVIDLEEVLARRLPGESQDFFARFIDSYHFYDLLLIHRNGEVFYTVRREADYETNILDGVFASSGLAHVVRESLNTKRFSIGDYAPYAPSNNQPALFMAHPLMVDGEVELVVALQLDQYALDEIMNQREGMGHSGETYLVGMDRLMRSATRLDPERALATAFIDNDVGQMTSQTVRQALEGNTGEMTTVNYRGDEVLSAYTSVTVGNNHWALIAEISEAEALEAVDTLQFLLSAVAVVMGGLVLAGVTSSTQRIVRPLELVNDNLKSLARGLPVTTPIHSDRNDEIGQIVRSAAVLRNAMRDTIAQARAVADGHYDNEVELLSEEDQLGQALAEMTRTLRDITTKNYREDWIKTGQAQLSARMTGEQAVKTLGEQVVNYLTPYLGAQIGALYLLEETDEGAVRLRMVASHAYSFRKQAQHEFLPGEGVVGQAALELKAFVLTDPPADYLSISTGLGESHPRAILVQPIVYEGDLKAVIELASFQAFQPLHLDFMAQVASSIGVAITTAQSRLMTQALLSRSQRQAQELETKSQELLIRQSELEQANEELQSQTEELQSQTEELQTQQEELRQANDELEVRGQELQRQRQAVEKQNRGLQQAQQEVEAKASELERASRYKSEFLANMSHELRTPLNSLLILAGLLLENKHNNLQSQQLEYLQTIHGAGSDLLRLINEILDLSRVEAGKIQVAPEWISLASLLEGLHHQFKPMANEKGLTLEIHQAADLTDQLYTDSQRLGQILINLLSNAIKFTQQGQIRIETAAVTGEQWQQRLAVAEDPGKQLMITVSDTGIGIAEEQQRLIFEAFQQADGTTSRRFGGTGLGLAIARQLARLLGGDLYLQSQPGRGSSFSLYLPVCYQSEDVAAEPLSAMTSSVEATQGASTVESVVAAPAVADDRDRLAAGDRRLLIIEDDAAFCNILLDLAHDKGFKVVVAQDGRDGLALVEQYQPQAILLDVGLPQLDGWSVMERLKDNPQTRHIPVHFISATDQVHEARRMGAIGFCLKPASLQELAGAFRRIETFLSTPLRKLLVLGQDSVRNNRIQELVDNEGLVVRFAAGAMTAMKLLQEEIADCIVVDMEQGQVVELLQQLRDNHELAVIPIILFTERPLRAEEEAALVPFDKDLTVKTVNSLARLLDETTLFLHQVEAQLPPDKQRLLRLVHDKESILADKKVLLVDDDARNTFALTTALEDKNMAVVTAENGREALALLEHQPDMDIVLMDIMMPEMDGFEAIRRIRAQRRFHQLPIIALTAKAMKSDKGKCIDAGANDYLSKPVNVDKLVSMMRVWLYR